MSQAYSSEILKFIEREEGDFDRLALQLFRYQFENNFHYREFCRGRGKGPEVIRRWQEIPPVPTNAFKVVDFACQPIHQAQRVFLSSGTMHGEGSRSRHFMFQLEIYEAAVKKSFADHMLPDNARLPMLVLFPPLEELPTSSLGYMFDTVVRAFGATKSDWFIRRGKLNSELLARMLSETEHPVCLLGTSLSFVHFFDFCRDRGLRFSLPAGSRLMDTGGFKGKGKDRYIPREEFYWLCQDMLGISSEFCVNEYGMAEMSSQFYDGVVGRQAPRVYQPPPWVRTIVVDPETLQEVEEREVGLLRHYDLANLDSMIALQTEDLGRKVKDGFELIGRAQGAELRGCSLLVEELLGAKEKWRTERN